MDVQVLIAGAGPTGLTLAVDLARRGVRCRVVDKAAEHFTGSRGKGLQPRSQEVFEDLGVLDAVRAAGGPYPALRAYDGSTVLGDRVMFERREPTPDVPYPNLLMIAQWRTEQILRERLAEFGVTVELGTEVTGFEDDDEGVTVTLGGAERVRAEYLVGADGGRSFVRRALGVEFHGETIEHHRALIGDVAVDGLDRDHWHVWPKAVGGAIALCPMPGTDSYQFTVQLDADAALPELTLPALRELFEARTGRTDLRLQDLTAIAPYRVNVRMVDRYRVGRVILAGDAAHVHPPAGGQGMNTGVQDAYNLGWKLARVLAGAPDALLDTYQEERMSVAAEVLGLSTKLYPQGMESRRGDETTQLALTYRGGPLASDDRVVGSAGSAAAGARAGAAVQAPMAGDRAPDAPVRDAAGVPTRLFEVFRGPQLTLLAFGAGHDETLAEVRARYGDAVHAFAVAVGGDLEDVAGHARRAYGVPEGALVLVRPDGYLGLISAAGSGTAVLAYLDALGAGVPAVDRR